MAEHAGVDCCVDVAGKCERAKAAGACRQEGDSANEECLGDPSMGHMAADSRHARPLLSSGGQGPDTLEEQSTIDCDGDMAHPSKEAAASEACSNEDCYAAAEHAGERSVEHMVAERRGAASAVASGWQGASAMAEHGAVNCDLDMAGAR